jgi:hypothetical protein
MDPFTIGTIASQFIGPLFGLFGRANGRSLLDQFHAQYRTFSLPWSKRIPDGGYSNRDCGNGLFVLVKK